MKNRVVLIASLIFVLFYISCKTEDSVSQISMHQIPEKELIEIYQNSIHFRDNSKTIQKIEELDKKIKTNPSNKNNLLIKKIGYQIALLKYLDAKQTNAEIEIDKDGNAALVFHYFSGLLDFLLGNDDQALMTFLKLKSVLLKIGDKNYPFSTRIDPLLKIIYRRMDIDKQMKIRKKFPISNQKGCFFMDVNPGDYTVTWSGKCANGFTHGDGVLTYSHGTVFSGLMEDGEMIKGRYQSSNGSVFNGTFRNGTKKGCVLYEDGDQYCGKFKNNKPDGEGVHSYSHGDKIEGVFKEGRPIKGKAFCSSGKRTQYKITRSLENGIWLIAFDCKRNSETGTGRTGTGSSRHFRNQ